MYLTIKNRIKKSYAGIFISLCLSFMLLFYEPLNIFANNLNDFWFDIYRFFPVVILQTIISFLLLSSFFMLMNKLNRKVYIFFVVIFLIILICTYIQGNFLSYSLPSLNGSTISFANFETEKNISSLLWKIVLLIIVVVLYKFKFKTIEKVSMYSSIVIIVMLTSSMFPFFMKKGFFESKTSIVATNRYLNNMSSDKNFIIFLIDATDSQVFNKEVKKLGKDKTLFKDFTYYPDTLAAYPFTRNSIPFIFSGEWYENEINFTEYFTKSFDDSKFLNKLEENGYSLNMYEYDLNNYNGDEYERFDNVDKVNNMDYISLLKQEAKIILYKYLPYQLKEHSHINTFNMNNSKLNNDMYSGNNLEFYNKIRDKKINIVDKKMFKFIHIEGGHVPFVYDINLNTIENGTYEQNLDASITILEAYINRLKENNVYDNSVIVVMADHGYGTSVHDRYNPILYIKGLNEKHNFEVSDKKISFVDLIVAFNQLIDGDKTDTIFIGLNNKERRYLLYDYTNPGVLIEEIQKGEVWNSETIVESGKKFISG